MGERVVYRTWTGDRLADRFFLRRPDQRYEPQVIGERGVRHAPACVEHPPRQPSAVDAQRPAPFGWQVDEREVRMWRGDQSSFRAERAHIGHGGVIAREQQTLSAV